MLNEVLHLVGIRGSRRFIPNALGIEDLLDEGNGTRKNRAETNAIMNVDTKTVLNNWNRSNIAEQAPLQNTDKNVLVIARMVEVLDKEDPI